MSSPNIKLLSLLVIAVAFAVLMAHWPALSAKALSFDDNQYLMDNMLVQNPSWTSARLFLTEILKPSTVEGYYQPLAMISLMLDYALGGRENNLLPFHITSLALHIANTALIIILLYLLFGQIWVAAAVGLLFGVHPMTVETIPWVGERKTLLAAFFSLWSLILYVYPRVTGHKSRVTGFYIGSLITYLLALMSKPTSTPLPVVMLLLDYWPLKRLSWKAILEKMPFFAFGGISAIITVISQTRTCGTVMPSRFNPGHIPLVLCHNIIFYLHKIIWPVNLSSHYAFPEPMSLSHPMVLAGVIGTFVLLALLVFSLRWTRAALTGWLIFFVAIFPTMGAIGFTNVIASDKFAYLPSLGLLMVLASFLGACRGNCKAVIKFAAVLAVIASAAAETVATQRYLMYWRDSVTLYERMLTLTPNSAEVYNGLGYTFYLKGKVDDEVKYFRKALELRPDYPPSYCNLGNALVRQGRLDEAISCYRQALQMKPNYTKVYHNLGQTLELQGKFDEAAENFIYTLRLKPDSAETHFNLARCLSTTGNFEDALLHYRRSLELKPDYVPAINGLAWILAVHPDPNMCDANEAVVLAERAAELTNYGDAGILSTLSAAYAAKGRFSEAITMAQKALDIAVAGQDNRSADLVRRQLEMYKQGKSLE